MNCQHFVRTVNHNNSAIDSKVIPADVDSTEYNKDIKLSSNNSDKNDSKHGAR